MHGRAVSVPVADPAFGPMLERLLRTYGHGPEGWPEPVVFFRIDPSWMTAFAMGEDEVRQFEAERLAAVAAVSGAVPS